MSLPFGSSFVRRLHRVIGGIVVVGFIAFAWLGYDVAKDEAESDLKTAADHLHAVLMSTRRTYHLQFLASGIPLTDKTLGFLPAHAMNKISKDIDKWDKSGFSFNNVSDRPRNDAQNADAVEIAAMEYFRNNPQKDVRFVAYTTPTGEPFYHYARPIWIETYCLQCHGDRDKAPETIRNRYETAYDYKVGDLRGVMSLKFPAASMQARLRQRFLYTLAWTGSTLLVLWLAVGYVVRKQFVKPLTSLRQGIKQLGGGGAAIRLGSLEGEFGEIGRAFDEMATALTNERNLLIESEERFRKLATTATDAIVLATSDGTIRFWNPAAEHLFGYQEGEVIGKRVTVVIPVRYREAHLEALKKVLEGTAPQHSGHPFEVVGLHADGSEIPLEVSVNTWEHNSIHYFVAIVRDIRERKAADQEIRELAFYDPLTRLPNRRLLIDRLGQAMASSARSGRFGAVMLIDLDNFKMLNDSLGHEVGDQLLVEAANRFVNCMREGDTVVRFGGDEFIVILRDLDSGDQAALQAERVGEKIRLELGKPYLLSVLDEDERVGTRSYQCTSSIGITLFSGNSLSIDELIKRADTAMYQAKQNGRDSLRFFDPIMQITVLERAEVERDLRKAIIEHQFVVHYQAQVNSAGKVVGAECLVRWRHPKRGMISPAQFIPVAEDTGLILPIGNIVLNEACERLAMWSRHTATKNLTIAVNVSARQFSNPNFVEEIRSLISHYGAPPDKLKLELTESLLAVNTEDIIAKMSSLRDCGVGFSMDDFGTGYSSLSYLKRLPLDQLKIDQSFVREVLTDSNDAAIAQLIVTLGTSLGISVIAEGVETTGQRDFLERSGCFVYQGYLFSKPVPVEAFEALIA